ncbi:MAG TPA: hypothetical protein VGG29_09475 [Caulobacteraceae bacterium]|jgi:hypothetical protein
MDEPGRVLSAEAAFAIRGAVFEASRPSPLALLAALALAAPALAQTRQLSDADLVAYAARPFDKEAMMGRQVTLGLHNGAPVVADFPCSDLCPAYTVRIIHYEAPPGPACERIGGVTRNELVPRGIGVAEEPFCVPKPLAGRE